MTSLPLRSVAIALAVIVASVLMTSDANAFRFGFGVYDNGVLADDVEITAALEELSRFDDPALSTGIGVLRFESVGIELETPAFRGGTSTFHAGENPAPQNIFVDSKYSWTTMDEPSETGVPGEPVPLPASVWLLGGGLVVTMGGRLLRRR